MIGDEKKLYEERKDDQRRHLRTEGPKTEGAQRAFFLSSTITDVSEGPRGSGKRTRAVTQFERRRSEADKPASARGLALIPPRLAL